MAILTISDNWHDDSGDDDDSDDDDDDGDADADADADAAMMLTTMLVEDLDRCDVWTVWQVAPPPIRQSSSENLQIKFFHLETCCEILGWWTKKGPFWSLAE